MSAVDKTEQLLRIDDLPLSLMVKNPKNPNKMKPREFDLLCDNMTARGWTEPVLLRPFDVDAVLEVVEGHSPPIKHKPEILSELIDRDLKFSIVGGHHRFDAGTFLGF